MAWVVDTCLLIDVAEGDPTFGVASARLLDSKHQEGLTICPITYIELSPVFNGDQAAQNEFLFNLGVVWPEDWNQVDAVEAHGVWHHYVAARRATKSPKRPIADILIGSFASRFDGVLTRNGEDFKAAFPHVAIIPP